MKTARGNIYSDVIAFQLQWEKGLNILLESYSIQFQCESNVNKSNCYIDIFMRGRGGVGNEQDQRPFATKCPRRRKEVLTI